MMVYLGPNIKITFSKPKQKWQLLLLMARSADETKASGIVEGFHLKSRRW